MSENRAARVAVVIPCFNDGQYVAEAVESARAQEPDEIVVVDDGSYDERTIEELVRLEKSGLRVVRQPNAGLASARMAGVQATRAPYVMVLDADDRVANDALSRMAVTLDSNPRVDVVWGDVERFGAAGYRLYPKAKSLDPWRITFINELVGTTMVRRTSLLEVGGWTLRRAMEDWDLWMRMAQSGMVGRHVGGVTLLYRVEEPRMYQAAMRDFDEGFTVLRTRNAALFEARSSNRSFAAASSVLKLLWTGLSLLPLPPTWQRYAYFGALLVCEPSRRRRSRA